MCQVCSPNFFGEREKGGKIREHVISLDSNK